MIGTWNGHSYAKFEIKDYFSSGDRIAVRLALIAKHTSEMMGIPPTGKTFQMNAIGLFRPRGGKFAENWVTVHVLGMMQHLRIVPPKPK